MVSDERCIEEGRVRASRTEERKRWMGRISTFPKNPGCQRGSPKGKRGGERVGKRSSPRAIGALKKKKGGRTCDHQQKERTFPLGQKNRGPHGRVGRNKVNPRESFPKKKKRLISSEARL